MEHAGGGRFRQRRGRVRSFAPVARADARILILGSMPGVASLKAQQYYAHPRNAFWPIMGRLFGAGPELDYARRLEILQNHGIALWDVLHSCRRPGSLDSEIRRDGARINDIPGLLAGCPGIRRICFNGRKAEQLFHRHARPLLGEPALSLAYRALPSTSPAHVGMRRSEKLARWRRALIDNA